jgi:hypothetical protein
MYQYSEHQKNTNALQTHPHLIFFTELDGPALHHLLMNEQLIHEMVTQEHGLALALRDFTTSLVNVVRHLNAYGIYTVAWLLLSPEEGGHFNLQNYPQAIEQYQKFHTWACQHQLHFDAVGLDIEPPAGEVLHIYKWGLRDIARRLWLAQENVLYPAARMAYTDLIARIHHDGYEVHIYQTPLLVDDRRAGTTLIQRAMDVVDLPADVEVLLFYRSLPIESMSHNLEGALIASYGPAVDSIGIGDTGGTYPIGDNGWQSPPIPWNMLERDLLLAAEYTDTIYLYSFEGCLERNLLPHIAQMDWSKTPSLPVRQRLLIEMLRSILAGILLLARYSQALLAWLGWVLAIVLFFKQIRCWKKKRRQEQ